MRRFTAKSIVLTSALLFAAPAMAQSLDQLRANCTSSDPNAPALQSTGCTALIESGLETTENLAIAFSNRGNSYARQKDYARAISDYGQAISINPQFANALSGRGLAYAQQQDYARAIADFDQAISINPQFANAFYNRGKAYAQQKDYARAIADFDEAIRINPQHDNADIARGLAKLLLGMTARATPK